MCVVDPITVTQEMIYIDGGILKQEYLYKSSKERMNKIIGKSDITHQQIAEIFEIDVSVLKDINILVFLWSLDGCEESIFCLFEEKGKLFAVYAYHCSCDGFEGLWDPEETRWKELRASNMYGYEFAEGYADFLVLRERKSLAE